MKLSHITRNESSRLLLIFAGWGMDERPFKSLTAHDYDLAVAYEHTTQPSEETIGQLAGYAEICIVAWSFGVIAASHFIKSNPKLPVTAKIAVNGTLYPVDNRLGIPEAIFNGTLEHLSPASLMKFYRRMCGSSAKYAEFASNMPERDIDSLKEELRAIASLGNIDTSDISWDTVFITDSDMIIPTANQHAAWAFHHDCRTIKGAHLPDFQDIINATIARKPLVAERFAKASKSYTTHAVAQRDIADRLAKLWHKRMPQCRKALDVLEIGAGTGLFTQSYLQYATPANLTLWDMIDIPPELPGTHKSCDAETAIRGLADASVDAIASASTIQWFNSPASFIAQCARVLRPGGIAVLSTFGPANYRELRQFSQSTPHYLTTDQWHSIADAYFKESEITEQLTTIDFESPIDLLRHMHNTGVNATTSTDTHAAARAIIASDTKRLTYNPIYIILIKSDGTNCINLSSAPKKINNE